MSRSIASFFIGIFFFIPIASVAGGAESLVICKNKGTVRTLRVEKTPENGCKAFYTKMGVDELIGSGQLEGACGEYAAKVRKTLEDVSWSCRDIKESKITSTQVDPR